MFWHSEPGESSRERCYEALRKRSSIAMTFAVGLCLWDGGSHPERDLLEQLDCRAFGFSRYGADELDQLIPFGKLFGSIQGECQNVTRHVERCGNDVVGGGKTHRFLRISVDQAEILQMRVAVLYRAGVSHHQGVLFPSLGEGFG